MGRYRNYLYRCNSLQLSNVTPLYTLVDEGSKRNNKKTPVSFYLLEFFISIVILEITYCTKS